MGRPQPPHRPQNDQRPRSVDEIIRERGNRIDALDAIDRLHGAGLIHRNGEIRLRHPRRHPLQPDRRIGGYRPLSGRAHPRPPEHPPTLRSAAPSADCARAENRPSKRSPTPPICTRPIYLASSAAFATRHGPSSAP